MKWINILLLLLTGCSTKGLTPSSAVIAPDNRIFSYQGDTGRSDGSIIVTRDSGFVGKTCLNSIYINGNLSARLAVAEKVHFTVETGNVTVTAGKDPYGSDMCQMHQGDPITQTLVLSS